LHRTRNDGFTFIETLVAISILLIVGMLLYTALHTTLSAGNKTKTTAMESRQLLLIDTALREATQDVTIPYWEKAMIIKNENLSVEFPWLGGKKNNKLIISIDNGHFILKTVEQEEEQTTQLAGNVSDVCIKVLYTDTGIPAGCTFTYTLNSNQYSTTAVFSSHPLDFGEKN
jgi:prepilin-type N-terminal cleavage/methylation domain-containing protein